MDEAVALLRKLVEGRWAGVFHRYPNDWDECCYCGAEEDWRDGESESMVHHAADCEITKAREWLAAREKNP